MKITSNLALAVALLLLRVAPLSAGTVQVGILNDSEVDKWRCDPSMPLVKPPAEYRCASAKFQGCAACGAVVVSNNSDAPVDVKLKYGGAGFSESHPGGAFFGLFTCDGPNGAEGRHDSFPSSCGHLLPGKSCKEHMEFCPEQSGRSLGQVKVIIREGDKPRTTTFDLIGNAIYSPELQAADEARRRHVDELMKIPHVARVEINPTDDDIFIDVEVDEDGSLDKVRRAAPPKIEGYDVEVTRYSPVGYGF